MKPKPLTLDSLEVGAQFETVFTKRKGTLLTLGPAAAGVRWDGSETRTIPAHTVKGKLIPERTINVKQPPEAISLKTEVRAL